MTLAREMALESEYVMGTFARKPVEFVEGHGMTLIDDTGKEYLDFLSGIGVCSLGHCHPSIVQAVSDQAAKLIHVSNYYYIEHRGEVAQLLSNMLNAYVDEPSPETWKTFFANSGAEANEGQIKLARKYAKDHGHPERFVVITMKNSFHGRTLATCTATGQYAVHRYFEPLPSGFRYAEFNNLQSVKDIMDEYVCAILTEPVQGEGGVRPASQEFLQGLRDLCDEKGILLMFDEVQVGSGRTGKLFAHQNYGVEPDTCSMAKALGSGVPIGAVCARGDAAKTLTPGTHGSTFAGGPLACALAATTLDVMINEGVIENARVMGEYFRDQMHKVIEKNHPKAVNEIRGLGMINGIQLNHPSGQPVVDLCYKDANVLINNTNGNVLRFVPPLITGKEEIDLCIKAVDDAMTKLGW